MAGNFGADPVPSATEHNAQLRYTPAVDNTPEFNHHPRSSRVLQEIRALSGPRSHPSQLSFPSPPRLELSLSPLRGHPLRVPRTLAMLLRDHVQHVPAMSVEFDMLQLAAV